METIDFFVALVSSFLLFCAFIVVKIFRNWKTKPTYTPSERDSGTEALDYNKLGNKAHQYERLNENNESEKIETALTDDQTEPKGQANFAIVVLTASQLTPIDDTATSEKMVLESYSTDDWTMQHKATTTIRRLLLFNEVKNDPNDPGFVYNNFDLILSLLTNGVGSLRSAVSKNALYAVDELFQHLAGLENGRFVLLNASDRTIQAAIDILVLKAVSEKRFIASTGIAAICTMLSSIPSVTVLLPLMRHSKSKNIKVCTLVAQHGYICLEKVLRGPEKNWIVENLDISSKLVLGFADLEISRSVDAIKRAQDGLCLLYSLLRREMLEKILSTSMNQAQAARVLKIVTHDGSQRVTAPKSNMKNLIAERRREMMVSRCSNVQDSVVL